MKTDRVIHFRHEEPAKNEVGIVACGLPNVAIWSDHRIKRVTCDGCKTIAKVLLA
jgi:hypothetical protein